MITVNSYAATPERLEREGVGELFESLQKRALDLAHEAREAAGEDGVLIAGCLPPLFGSYHPSLTIPFADTLAIYRRVVAEEADRVDLMLCETMASAQEALRCGDCGGRGRQAGLGVLDARRRRPSAAAQR